MAAEPTPYDGPVSVELPAGPVTAEKIRAGTVEAPKFEVATAEQAAVHTLMEKLEKWLMMQPEWALLFLGKRSLRRQVAKEIAHRIFTLPVTRWRKR